MYIDQRNRSEATTMGFDMDEGVTTRIGTVVAEVLSKHGVAGAVAVDADLGHMGMTSIDMVELMLGIEAEFDIAVPAKEITLKNFSSVASIAVLVSRLTSGDAARHPSAAGQGRAADALGQPTTRSAARA